MRKDEVNTYFENLTGVDNDTLDAEIKRRQNLMARMDVMEASHGKLTHAGDNLNGTYTRDELKFQLDKLTKEQNRRNLKTDSPADWAKRCTKEISGCAKDL